MKSASSAEIVEAFDDMGFTLDEPKLIDAIAGLLVLYPVGVERFSTEYMAWILTHHAESSVTGEKLDRFETEKLAHLAAEDKRNQARNITNVASLLMDDDGDDDSDISAMYGMSTPKVGTGTTKRALLSPAQAQTGSNKRLSSLPGRSGAVPSLTASPSSIKFTQRTNQGDTLIKFGQLPSTSQWVTDNSVLYQATIRLEGSAVLSRPYRYMHESLRDKAGVLDETICRLGEDILSHVDRASDEVQSFVQICQDPILTVGRICCDHPEGRLNPQSILLQGNQELSGGRTIAMDVAGVGEYALFPGQVVSVQGINPNGSRLMAQQIMANSGLPGPARPDRVNEHSGPLDVLLASGPYSTSDNLENQPLHELIVYIRKHKPHVAILHGPFLDIRNRLVEGGDLELAFGEKFQAILTHLATQTRETPTQFVVVASAREAHHHVVYPTPPYEATALGETDRERFTFVSDPSVVSIEGVTFGLTSSDILMHLGKEEIVFPSAKDRIRRISSHLIQQRSFYPLYPPNPDMSIDFDKLDRYATLSTQPHILVLPSDLAHFYKEVNGGLVLNPGRMAKGEQGGVFARLRIHPPTSDRDTFIQRVLGEIVRI